MTYSSVIRSFALFGAFTFSAAACSGGDLDDAAPGNPGVSSSEEDLEAAAMLDGEVAREAGESTIADHAGAHGAPLGELQQSLAAQQPSLGCALFCAPGTVLDPSGACRCVPENAARGCEVILCRQGFRCVESALGTGTCIPS